MIEGTVNASREAVITLALHGPTGRTRDVDVVIDTGYNDTLMLPPTVVTELGLPLIDSDDATLADGSNASFDVCEVAVLWDGRLFQTDALVANSVPLIGMALLEWHNLNIDVIPGGQVAIQAIP